MSSRNFLKTLLRVNSQLILESGLSLSRRKDHSAEVDQRGGYLIFIRSHTSPLCMVCRSVLRPQMLASREIMTKQTVHTPQDNMYYRIPCAEQLSNPNSITHSPNPSVSGIVKIMYSQKREGNEHESIHPSKYKTNSDLEWESMCLSSRTA